MPKSNVISKISTNLPGPRPDCRETRIFDISLLTPMFGGGVEAGTPDERMPIRATAIRGHLQFWWRATCGAACSNAEQLVARSSEIWGATEKASPVQIDLIEWSAASPKACATRRNDGRPGYNWDARFRNALPYALFPFQGSPADRHAGTREKPPSSFIESAAFKLRLRYPRHLANDVETAVRAWVNFGGLGARTRRGCGSLRCKELAPKNGDELIQNERLGPPCPVRDWPTLSPIVLIGVPAADANAAWAQVIGILREFRQGVDFARSRKPDGGPGRSRWPEPESIRRATGFRLARHPRNHTPDHAFPRAELGLPIVFQFKDERQGDPPKTQLYPVYPGEKCERMASPLVLKPLALADATAVPAVVRLVGPTVQRVVLEGARVNLPPRILIRDPELANDKKSPLSMSRSGSAIEAFLAYAASKGFTEIRG